MVDKKKEAEERSVEEDFLEAMADLDNDDKLAAVDKHFSLKKIIKRTVQKLKRKTDKKDQHG